MTDYCNYQGCVSYIIRPQPPGILGSWDQAELAVTSARPAKFKVPRGFGGVGSKVRFWTCLKMEYPKL